MRSKTTTITRNSYTSCAALGGLLLIVLLLCNSPAMVLQQPELLTRRPLATYELLLMQGMVALTLISVHNAWVTPNSKLGTVAPHVWMGRLGLVLGGMGYLTGLALAISVVEDALLTSILAFAGSMSAFVATKGYLSIVRYRRMKEMLSRRNDESVPIIVASSATHDDDLTEECNKALQDHAFYMRSLLIIGFVSPFWLRMVGHDCKADDTVLVVLATAVGVYLLFHLHCNRYEESPDVMTPADNDDEYGDDDKDLIYLVPSPETQEVQKVGATPL